MTRLVEKALAIFCVLFGHAKVYTYCFGYIHCARCDDLVGDSLLGSFSVKGAVVVGHACAACQAAYKTLTWVERAFVSDPLVKREARN